MSKNRCELTDKQSVVKRMWLRAQGCFMGLGISVLLFYFLNPNAAGVVFKFGMGAVAYMVFAGYALDRWRLAHPEATTSKVRQLSQLATVPIFVAILIHVVTRVAHS